jgi:hypothetical protein
LLRFVYLGMLAAYAEGFPGVPGVARCEPPLALSADTAREANAEVPSCSHTSARPPCAVGTPSASSLAAIVRKDIPCARIPSGEMIANVLATCAQFERRLD